MLNNLDKQITAVAYLFLSPPCVGTFKINRKKRNTCGIDDFIITVQFWSATHIFIKYTYGDTKVFFFLSTSLPEVFHTENHVHTRQIPLGSLIWLDGGAHRHTHKHTYGDGDYHIRARIEQEFLLFLLTAVRLVSTCPVCHSDFPQPYPENMYRKIGH